jgi:hypothetical protein
MVLSLLTASCAGTSSVVMVDHIRPGNGYALMVVHGNWESWQVGLERLQLHYRHETGEQSGKVRMRRSGELELVELPAGNYRWQEIQFGQARMALREGSGFTVVEGTLNYIGDVFVAYDAGDRRLVDVRVEDNEAVVRARVAAANAPLLARYGLGSALMILAAEAPPPDPARSASPR